MKFIYWLDCINEELVIELEEAYEMEELIDIANTAYERKYVNPFDLPKYIVDCFKELGYKVKDWHIEGGEG